MSDATNPPSVKRTPWIKEDEPGRYSVGCEDRPASDFSYSGPTASIYADDSYVYVVNSELEGLVVLNVEALPLLIEALQKLKSHLDSVAIPHQGQSKGEPMTNLPRSDIERVYGRLIGEFGNAGREGDKPKAARLLAAIDVFKEWWPNECEKFEREVMGDGERLTRRDNPRDTP